METITSRRVKPEKHLRRFDGTEMAFSPASECF